MYDNLANYKIESISNIKILDEPIRKLTELPNMQDFSIKQYIKEHIYMVSGGSVNTTIKIDDAKRINDIISWFGEDLSVYTKDGTIYANLNINEESLVYWALQYANHVEITEPQTTRKKIKEMIDILNKKYGE